MVIAALAGASGALAEDGARTDTAPQLVFRAPIFADSGFVSCDAGVEETCVVDTRTLHVPGAAWVRLDLTGTFLAGEAGSDDAVLRVTSLTDGDSQTLNAEHLRFWKFGTGAFNGDTVMIELVSRGGVGASRLVVAGAEYGPGTPNPFGARTICDTTDDRMLSTDARTGRTGSGCTAWMFDDANKMLLTAGHCTTGTFASG